MAIESYQMSLFYIQSFFWCFLNDSLKVCHHNPPFEERGSGPLCGRTTGVNRRLTKRVPSLRRSYVWAVRWQYWPVRWLSWQPIAGTQAQTPPSSLPLPLSWVPWGISSFLLLQQQQGDHLVSQWWLSNLIEQVKLNRQEGNWWIQASINYNWSGETCEKTREVQVSPPPSTSNTSSTLKVPGTKSSL